MERCTTCGGHAKVVDVGDERRAFCLRDGETAFQERELKVWRWIGGVLPHEDVSPLGNQRKEG